jgi:hypothetical protein
MVSSHFSCSGLDLPYPTAMIDHFTLSLSTLIAYLKGTRCMILLTDEIKATLPALYSQERVQDPMVHCKFFTPDGPFAWFLTEYSHEDGDTCYGWIITSGEGEWGYFSLQYLQDRLAESFIETFDTQGKSDVQILGDRIPEVVRDETFSPMRFSEVKRRFEETA